MNKIINEAYEESIKLLHRLATDDGFTASTGKVQNYKRVWSRDGVVIGLASLLDGDETLINHFKSTLDTLKKFQDETGRIVSNVSLNEETHISYGTTVGRVDATIWYIIGVTQFALNTKDKKFFEKHKKAVDKAIFYLSCLELNDKGLIYIPQGGDWADEYVNHGYVLFDQVLHYLALDGYHKITKDEKVQEKKERLKNIIKINYLPKKENIDSPFVYNKLLFEKSLSTCKLSLPIPYFTSYSTSCSVANFANSLLVLSGILEEDEGEKIKEYTKSAFLDKEFAMLPAFYPVIKKKDEDWDELEDNFLFSFKNNPYEYQNGGLWPWVNGFFLSSLGKKDKDGIKYLEAFAEILKKDGYVFPEYYHGKNHKPMGVMNIGNAASAYIIAYNSIIKNKKVFL
ncbi:glycoside hydrolase 100 family protein [Patescibacteria group bacterium]